MLCYKLTIILLNNKPGLVLKVVDSRSIFMLRVRIGKEYYICYRVFLLNIDFVAQTENRTHLPI